MRFNFVYRLRSSPVFVDRLKSIIPVNRPHGEKKDSRIEALRRKQGGIFLRKKSYLFRIRSHSPQQAVKNALAIAVREARDLSNY